MDLVHAYVVITIGALLIVALLVFRSARRPGSARLSPLSALALAFVASAVLFGEQRPIGYGLIMTGVVLAAVDLVRRMRTA
jgi:hypothetical protein